MRVFQQLPGCRFSEKRRPASFSRRDSVVRYMTHYAKFCPNVNIRTFFPGSQHHRVYLLRILYFSRLLFFLVYRKITSLFKKVSIRQYQNGPIINCEALTPILFSAGTMRLSGSLCRICLPPSSVVRHTLAISKEAQGLPGCRAIMMSDMPWSQTPEKQTSPCL